ncbi:hypothetical protein STEG23_016947 [Scotinomys teguina]
MKGFVNSINVSFVHMKLAGEPSDTEEQRLNYQSQSPNTPNKWMCHYQSVSYLPPTRHCRICVGGPCSVTAGKETINEEVFYLPQDFILYSNSRSVERLVLKKPLKSRTYRLQKSSDEDWELMAYWVTDEATQDSEQDQTYKMIF